MPPQGVLLVDKPSGWTSFDVVNYVRKIVAQVENKRPKQVKVGHSGTLDPFATGLLVLLVGKDYTRRAAELTKLDKTYEVSLRLGQTSSTGDPEGEITPVNGPKPSKEDIQKTLRTFKGSIKQVPPAYSAIKVGGQRAYKLARAGKAVALEPRTVTIHSLELTSYDYPKARLITEVSSGTYIRSLVEDIGRSLGTGAYTAELRRTKIGNFELVGAVKPQEITSSNILTALKPL